VENQQDLFEKEINDIFLLSILEDITTRMTQESRNRMFTNIVQKYKISVQIREKMRNISQLLLNTKNPHTKKGTRMN
jgi:hypothetical protein